MTSPAWNGLLLLLVAVAAAEGLLAVWAAVSGVHWFVRALAVWGGVMLLIPVRVYEPALLSAIAGPLTVGWLLIALRSRRREASSDGGRMRYGVRDLMLLTVLVALVIVGLQLNPAVQEFDRQDWLVCLMCGALLSATVALAALLVLGRRRLAMLVALVAVIAIAAWAVSGLPANTKLVWLSHDFFVTWGSSRFDQRKQLALRFVEVAFLVAVFVGLAAIAQRAAVQRWRRSATVALGLASFLFAVPLVWLYWQMLWLTPLPPPFTGPANHYPRIVTIADALRQMGPIRPVTQALDRALIDEVVELADAPNFLPWNLERDANQDELARRHEEALSVFQLRFLLDAECDAAVTAGDYARASELAAAHIRLGVMLNRGGTISEALLGIPGVFAHRKLMQMRANLAPNEAPAILADLQRALAEVEDPDAIAVRGRAIEERAYGWRTHLENITLRFAGETSPSEELLRRFLRHHNTENWILQADLAARLFHHEHSRWPASLDELVPKYLPTLPLDPYSPSGQPLRYRTDPQGFVLYSVGWDGIDDGGKFGNGQSLYERGYDYDLDTLSRP